MAILPAIGLLLALSFTAQEPPDIPGLWGDEPSKAVEIKDPEAEAALEKRLLAALAAAERRGIEDPLLAQPLEELGVYYLGRKRSADAVPLFRRALAIREKSQGGEHPDVAKALVNLSVCQMVAKQKKAKDVEPMLRRALAIREKQGKDSPEVAHVLRTLGGLHMVRKDFDTAKAEFSRALTIREKIAADSEETAAALNDLGTLYMFRTDAASMEDIAAKIAGKPQKEWPSVRLGAKAEEYLKRALAIREKLLDRDDDHIARTLFDLAQLALLRERPEEIEPYLKRWLQLREAAKAPPSEKHAKVYLMLAGASAARKDFDGADRWMAKTQEIVAKLNGPESDEMATTLSGRADMAQQAGRFDAADRLMSQAQEIAAKVHGRESDDVAKILLERADMTIKAGRFDEAEAFLKQALAIVTAHIEADDSVVVQIRDLMAGSYRDHVEDRKAPVLWHRLNALKREVRRRHSRSKLDDVIDGYARLLRKTNRVVPRPTEEDLAYLKKIHVVTDFADIDDLMTKTLLMDDKLDDEALPHISRMYGLEHLSLEGRGNRITDAGLAHLAHLVNLRVLMMVDTDITDAGLAHLAGLENLETLWLFCNRINGSGLVHLRGLTKLHRLHLSFTNVNDAALTHVEAMAGLRKLDLTHSRVTEAAVNRLRRARPDLEIEYSPGSGYMRPMVAPDSLLEAPAPLMPVAPPRP